MMLVWDIDLGRNENGTLNFASPGLEIAIGTRVDLSHKGVRA